MCDKIFIPLLLVIPTVSSRHQCYDLPTIDRSIRDQFCDNPIFITLLENTEESNLLDNICLTWFPLPDDPDTFQLYVSRVYCDGSNDVMTVVSTQDSIGVTKTANPFTTTKEYFIGYAGCDTYVVYHCLVYGEDDGLLGVFGLSTTCRPLGLSCLHKVEEIIKDSCLPHEDYYVLPMKLPNRCVTQQLCLLPPNPFHVAGGSGF